MLNSLAPVDSMGPFLAVANIPGKKNKKGFLAWKLSSDESV